MNLPRRETYILSRIKCPSKAPKGYFLTPVSLAEAHVFGGKFIGQGLMELFFLLRAIRDFYFWGDIWPAMYGVVCLSILLEGGVMVSNNFT